MFATKSLLLDNYFAVDPTYHRFIPFERVSLEPLGKRY